MEELNKYKREIEEYLREIIKDNELREDILNKVDYIANKIKNVEDRWYKKRFLETIRYTEFKSKDSYADNMHIFAGLNWLKISLDLYEHNVSAAKESLCVAKSYLTKGITNETILYATQVYEKIRTYYE